MRLTLRTLLAWQDGVLPDDEHGELSQRVAASTIATALARRLQAGTCRPDIATPRLDGWGTADDLNVVADYLDNTLEAGQIEWFERVCLQSDAHLAELSDCHAALAELSRVSVDEIVLPGERATALKARILPAVAGGPAAALGDAGAGAPAAVSAATTAWAPPVEPGSAAAPPVAPGLAYTETRVTTAADGGSAAAAAAGRACSATPKGGRGDRELPPPAEVSSARPRLPLPAGRSKPGRNSGSKKVWSEQQSALASLLVFVVVGAGAVTWCNSAASSHGPRRAAVKGFVTFDGAPVENGVILLKPAAGTQGPAAGAELSGGAFSIAAAAGPVVGRYRVEIKATRKTGRTKKALIRVADRKEVEELEQFIPAPYNIDSELEIEIKAGRNEVTLELKSPAQPGAASKSPRVAAGRTPAAPSQGNGAGRSIERPG